MWFWLILTGFFSFVVGIFIAGLMTNGKVADLENEISWLLSQRKQQQPILYFSRDRSTCAEGRQACEK